jgi:hypothetical protein
MRKRIPPSFIGSNIPNAPIPASADIELTRMFVDVPIRVQVPPTMET